MRRRRPEQQIQRAVVAHLKTRAVPGVVYLHPANGGGRSAIEGAILKGQGVIPGAPDLLLWCDNKSYALELKSEDGRTSEEQLAMLNKLSQAGVFTAVCHGLNRALAVLQQWGLLKGEVQ